MTCSCGRITNDPVPIGVQYDMDNAPALILFNCECKSTLAIPWGDATRAQRRDAFLADLSRQSQNEMQVWGG